MQTDGEAKVAKVVRCELQFPTFDRAFEAARDNAGIVDQEM